MADEAAATFFANLEQDRHTQADEGAEDFFAQLNSTAPTSSSSAKVILKKEKKTTKPSTKKSKQPKDQVVATKTDENHRAECKDEAGADQASVVVSTEERIVSLLVPGMTVPEIMTLVKKMRQAGKSESDEFTTTQESDLKTGPRFICDSCGNTEQNNFITVRQYFVFYTNTYILISGICIGLCSRRYDMSWKRRIGMWYGRSRSYRS